MALTELLDRIRLEQKNFSPSQKRVAAYVLANYKQIPFYSITALSEKIGVSHFSVITFCKNLGYNKFSEFKKELSRYAADLIIYNKLSKDEPRTEDSTQPDHFCDQAMGEDIRSIESTLSDPRNQQALPKLVELLNGAKYIYVMGGRSSAYFASLLGSFLRYLDLKVIDLMPGTGDYLDRLSMVTPDDLVIAINFPRYTTQIVNGLQQLHAAGIPVALITDTDLAPAHAFATLSFYCQVESSSYVQCYAGCLSLISAICRAASSSRRQTAAAHVHALEENLYEQGVFAIGTRSQQ